jgi:hypothetical protein
VESLLSIVLEVSSLLSDFGEIGFDVLDFSLDELFSLVDASSFVEDLLL